MTLRSGFNMPPGCFRTPADEPSNCIICFCPDDSCICPECPTCGEFGNPTCYEEPVGIYSNHRGKARKKLIAENAKRHSLRLTKEQVMARWRIVLQRANSKVTETKAIIKLLQNRKWPLEAPQDFGEECISDILENQPDPFREVLLTYE